MPDFDQRGTGLSDRPSQRYSMKLWADDCALLLDALGVERAHMNGSRALALNIATQVCSRAFLNGEQGAATVESIRELVKRNCTLETHSARARRRCSP